VTYVDDPLDYGGEKDTFIVKLLPTRNLSTATGLAAARSSTGAGETESALLYWDLTAGGVLGGVTPADTVCAAAIKLNVTAPGSGPYWFYALNRTWTFSEATWNQATATDAWEVPGAQGANDRGAYLGFFDGSRPNPTTIPINLGVVQRWVADATQNHGVIVVGGDLSSGVLTFSSRNWATWSQRPTLELKVVGP
jgi:hypothetical protein